MYRYESTYNCYDIGFLPSIQFSLKIYKVIKETTCGVWIIMPGYPTYKKKFINTNAIKQFAYKDRLQALEGYKHRKYRQAFILRWQLEHAEEALKSIDNTNGLPEAYEYVV